MCTFAWYAPWLQCLCMTSTTFFLRQQPSTVSTTVYTSFRAPRLWTLIRFDACCEKAADSHLLSFFPAKAQACAKRAPLSVVGT
mmetsp:Transcript_46758/g.100081  ORF Transcript_46758/g.100081 Transcript_46758/m.100081 type:complete len:84 (-) Transcript_46758:11-262(-)